MWCRLLRWQRSGVVCALALLFWPLTVVAAGNGIKVGSGRLHTSIEIETHDVQNPGYVAENPINDVYLLGRPVASLAFDGDMQLELKAELEYRQYLGVIESATRNFSRMAGSFGGHLVINPTGALVFRLNETFMRLADAANQTISTRLLHIVNIVGASVDYKPGGGALVVNVGYSLWYDRYDRDQVNLTFRPAALDSLRQLPTAKATWKFLPLTALLLEVQGVLTSYPGGGTYAWDDSTKNEEIDILKVEIGAVGNITSTLSALIKVGYGKLFADETDALPLVGQLELSYDADQRIKVRAGVLQTMHPTTFFRYFTQMRLYAGTEYLFLPTSQIRLHVTYDFQKYGKSLMTNDTNPRRNDGVLAGEIDIAHQFNDMLSLALIERLAYRDSNYRTSAGMLAGYLQNDLFLRFTVAY